MIEQIYLEQQEKEMERRYQEHLAEQLDQCKQVTLKRNSEKQKEIEQQRHNVSS